MVSAPRPVVLTIAGFDPSSGAGLTADLKTIAAHGCHGVAVITALTVQNSQGVSRVEPVEQGLVQDALSSLAADVELMAIKIGMIGTGPVARVVADFLSSHKGNSVVLDPVICSSSGHRLLDESGLEVVRSRLIPLATVVTPNLAEAEVLAGVSVKDLRGMSGAAKELQKMGAKNVVVTGGHLAENTDLLRLKSGEEIEVASRKVESESTHGTGCAFSTAIACRLALGDDLPEAVRAAKEYVRRAIEAAYPIGKGKGPMNHLFRME